MSGNAPNKLAEALQGDASLRDRFLSAKSLAERATVAAAHGHKVSADDLVPWFGADGEGELSDADLESIAGGALSGAGQTMISTCVYQVRKGSS
jgi:predicted ribosomally synthesized peptide with nif11-like leader